jgi:hypothetical protein
MPRLPENIQEPMALYPVVEELNTSRGVLAEQAEELGFDMEKRLKLSSLVRAYGDHLGPTENAKYDFDLLLDASSEDFKNASIDSLKTGLYIFPDDARYHRKGTEQLVRVGNWKGNNRSVPGIVFPSHEFTKVGHSPPGLTERAMAKTRASQSSKNNGNVDEGSVGRSAAHIMEGYISRLTVLDSELSVRRRKLYIPLYREVSQWAPHFKPKNLDKKRREFDEEIHEIIDTASLNINIGSTALKAAHRAVVSKLYRRGSAKELNDQWASHIKFAGDYLKDRREKISISKHLCGEELKAFQPFLDQAA